MSTLTQSSTGSGDFAEALRLWDGVMVASADRPLPAVILDGATALQPPAAQEAIAGVEERLRAELPPSYKAFLGLSDGAYANGCGIVTRSGEYGLLPAAHVCRLVAVAADHVRIWVEASGGVQPEDRAQRADMQGVRCFASLGDAVLLTPMIDSVCDCLVPVPPALDAGGERFEVWETFKEGAARFLTFERWLRNMVATQWVARRDRLVRSLLPEVAEQLAAVDRWAADPDYHWFAVGQVRRLAAAPRADHRVTTALDRLWQGTDPYLRLAAAQADLGHRPDRARERLAVLAGSATKRWAEPTVALAAASTLRVCDHPALNVDDG